MNFSKIIIILSLLLCGISSAQIKKVIEHKISVNETLSSIAKKYNVSTSAILALNPEAKSGIKFDTILLIPNEKKDGKLDKNVVITAETHTVLSKETKFSISKKYDISIENLEKLNPFILSDGLQVGQLLQLKAQKNKANLLEKQKTNTTPIYHIIEQQETKYSVSKKYGISIEELERQNPEIAANFPIGQKLVINSNLKSTVVVDKRAKEEPTSSAVKETKLFKYKVKKGETIYSLSRLFNWSEEKLVFLNPELKSGIEEGMLINGAEILIGKASEIKNNYQDLHNSIKNNSKKELVLFLPFNVNKIENDTVNSIGERLKKDKFLNLTLDFYSGALMAIDSAKVLNLNLNVRIYDSQETKNSCGAVQIINSFNFETTDVVIGPFYQTNVEKVAEILSDKSAFVISPLSKENGKSLKNLIQSMPTNEASKNTIFDFMRSKNVNIIAVIDPKKISIKQYIEQNQRDIKFVNTNDKGVFVSDSIKKHFIKNQLNYVVMESERTGVIFATTTALLNSLKDFQIQLVILEPNETLDFEEIALTRLTKLKMMFASTTFENKTDLTTQFERNYKKKNKIFPNQYAIRGFDLVFDTMVRLAQEVTFEETLKQNATQQIENKFNYKTKPAGGYANNGISIMYYDTDLLIKQAQ